MKLSRIASNVLSVLAITLLATGAATAQRQPDGYPGRSIRMIVPFPAGGPTDVIARLLGMKLTEKWGQSVVVENRPGANTVIGAQIVAKAPPDGYTLLLAIDSTLAMNQFLYRTPPYDPLKEGAAS
jgi:tripartite-type tricarboxylate transporter receptor subunit TctC